MLRLRLTLFVSVVALFSLCSTRLVWASCSSPVNRIEAENCLVGSPASEWDIPNGGAGDLSLQGFATDISVNVGGTVSFKINSSGANYSIDIYRMGYYGGAGARKVASVAGTPKHQPACGYDSTTGLYDCGNWSVTANWTIPADAVSGIYFAKLTRSDTGGASHVPFIVRDDTSHSALLFQTSDTTWQAYNYSDGFSVNGGNSLYGGHGPGGGAAPGRAYKVTYNRPFTTRGTSAEDFVFNAEYPMVRWLEANGYDVTYFTGMDAERYGSLIQNHQVYMSVGHDEYWSGGQRANVEAARAAHVNLAFFSGNEIFWKTRWESSNDGTATPYRTLVSYKETHANAVIDPMDPPTWTGTWRDTRFSPPADGGRPENALSGTIFMVNCCTYAINVPQADGRMRFWRNTPIATQPLGGTVSLPDGTLGYEWDADLDNGARPAGLFHLSTTTVGVPQMLLDFGSTYGPGVQTHSATLYRYPGGALVFGSGSVQWSWGLDANHDRGNAPPEPSMQQATVNLFADMGVQPATLQSPLIPATASTDTTEPTSSITSPQNGGSVYATVPVTIAGVSADNGGGVVAGVEVSTDGTTWHPAIGRENWSYTWTPPSLGSATVRVRAVDDSGNLEGTSSESLSTITLNVVPAPPPNCPATNPCSIFNNVGIPTQDAANDRQGDLVVGVRFQSDVDGFISGIQFLKGAGNTGTHVGQLWDNSGNLLGTVTFSGETASGWQQALFPAPVPISANTPYVATYYSPNGFYAFTDAYFTQDVYNRPLHGLADGVAGVNGVYVEPSHGPAFPTNGYQASNYWVDVLFTTTTIPDNTPPIVVSTNPVNGASGVAVSPTITVTFSKAMNASTISGSTFVLRDSGNNVVSATVTYNASLLKASLSPTSSLAYSSSYTVTVSGGSSGVQDTNGNPLANDYSWTFATVAAPPPPPDEGPGGPILVVSSSANPFSRYYAEILRAEGLDEFAAKDVSEVTATTLAGYDVVILGEFPLSSDQATMFTSWVNGGGNLIAMRPDHQLASMLGLTPSGNTASNAYLLINTGSGPGIGLTNQTIQYHGTADLYTASGATKLATLYSTASTPTSAPAVTIATYGAGQAAAFTYDLARSVVYTRQGNPAWSGLERDGITPIRSDDLYFGAASYDPEPDWIDLNKVAIPQADEQQRLMSNLILQMNLAKKPLPRFWFLPRGLKAAVVMTGDDHANGGTIGRFNTYLGDSTPNCNVANWECIRGTSYIYPNTPISDAQATAFVNQGFEIAVHVTTECADWTPATLEGFYADQLGQFASLFPNLAPPQTNRTHCIAWSDYDTQPQTELNHSIRFDTSYYYWPPSWIQDRPGMFTGSGMPMRFAKLDGTIIDVYQATTQMTDESGQSYPYNIDTLLNNALGANAYYGVFTANMHNDNPVSDGANAIVASAQVNGVPVVTSLQMLQWLDGRNGSSFGNLSWSGNRLQFNIAQGANANGLQALVPVVSSAGPLTGITSNNTPVTYTTQIIKGVQYALFAAATGSYTATYNVDTTPPVISNIATAPSVGSAVVTWTTDVLSSSVMNYGTASGNLNLSASTPGDVTSHSVTLSGLAANTTYYYQVTSTDAFNNTATAPTQPASFQTPSATLGDMSASDFGGGSGSCSVVNLVNSGGVILTPHTDLEFTGPSLPGGWGSNVWGGGGGYTFNGGAVKVDGADIFSGTSYGPGTSLEFVGTFSGDVFQHIGFITDGVFDAPWAIFSTGTSGGALYARVNTGGNSDNQVLLAGSWLGAPHRFRIDWMATNFVFSIDGNAVATMPYAVTGSMVLGASDLHVGGGNVSLSYTRLSPYASSCSYTSRVFDAGSPANWGAMTWIADTPTGTSVAMSYRFGSTPTPDASWSSFYGLAASPAALSGNSRYIQYQANLATSDTTHSPALSAVSISYSSGVNTTAPVITVQAPAPAATNVPVGTTVSVTFSEPMNAATINSSTFQLRDSSSNLVPAALSYASGTATLTPNAPLMQSMQYQVTVAGSVADLSGNQLGMNAVWTFTTGQIVLTHTDTTVADFSAGSTTCLVAAHLGDGEVSLSPAIDEEFSSTFPSDWTSLSWTGGAATVTGGQLVVDGAFAATNAFYPAGNSLEFVATFGPNAFQHVGFGVDFDQSGSFVIFSTKNTTNQLFARTGANGSPSSDFQIPNPPSGSWLGTPHHFRIDWTATGEVFWIDGSIVHTEAIAITDQLRPAVSDYNFDGIPVTVDWLLLTPYNSSCSFQSAVFDAGSPAAWSTLSWNALSPANTTLNLSYRTGNTPTPDGSWTAFTPVVSSGGALSGTSRYIQYEADFGTTDTTITPVLEDVTIAYTTGTRPPAITSASSASFTVGVAGTFAVTTTGNPIPTITESGSEGAPLPAGLTFVDNGNGTGTLSGTPATGTGGQYFISFTAHNGAGSDATQMFILTINEAPTITTQPASQAITTGQTATLMVVVNSSNPPSYQWYQGLSGDTSNPIGGATGSNYTTPALSTTTNYWVQVTNSVGQTNSNTATITVTTASQTITFAPLSDVAYGVAPFTLNATATSSLPVTYSVVSGAATILGNTLTVTGAGAVTVQADQAGNSMYSPAPSVRQSFNVTAAVLTVKANDASMAYGGTLPTFSAAITGFVNNDPPGVVSGTPSLATSATSASPVGSYDITASQGTLSAQNYTFTFFSGTLTINKASASVTPNAASKTYGTADLAFTGTLTGFLGSDNVSATYSRTSGETVGTYTISATLQPASVLGNYNIIYNTAQFTITKANASVTPNAASKIYGTADPAFTGTLTGFLGSDNVSATYSRTPGETVGTYTISATLQPAGVLGDYNIAYNTAVFTIQKANPTVTFTGAPASAAYGSRFTVSATTNSSSTAVITATGACSIAGNVVTMTSGTGVCNLAANWAADTNYNAASASQTTTAAMAASTTTITSHNPNPSNVNQPVTVAFAVTGSGTPSGAVTVNANTGENCTSVLSGGVGSCHVTFMAPGLKTLTATYSGDANFFGGTSAAVSQSVLGGVSSVSPTSLAFGNQLLNISSVQQTATLSNLGNKLLTISAITITGPNSADFIRAAGGCATTLNPGKTCAIKVAFKPSNLGPESAVVTITTSDPVTPTLTVGLSGTGVAPVLSLSTNSLNFGTIKTKTSSTMTVTVSNPGTAALRILSIVKSGTNSTMFALVNGCPGTLSVGGSCPVTVKFTPATTGPKSASFVVNVAAPATSQTVTMTGSGN